MTQGVVNELGRSQRGTPKLKVDGVWYVASRLNLDGIQPGTTVEYEPSSFPTNDGKQIKCINSIKPVASAPPRTNGRNPSAVSDDAEMRFISNCVGSAITAGTIKDPMEIAKWVAAARGAIGAPGPRPEFDDEIPY